MTDFLNPAGPGEDDQDDRAGENGTFAPWFIAQNVHLFPRRFCRVPVTGASTGVGRGWIFIRTDAANRPQGHWWGANKNTTTGYHSVAERPISFGWIDY